MNADNLFFAWVYWGIGYAVLALAVFIERKRLRPNEILGILLEGLLVSLVWPLFLLLYIGFKRNQIKWGK